MRKVLVAFFAMLFLLGIATSAFAAYSGTNAPTTFPSAVNFTAPLQDGDGNDNGQGNANATGKNVENTTDDTGTYVNDVIKSTNMKNAPMAGPNANQRTHGAYQLNTNSCASCHQTHTGAADDLLFKGLNSTDVSGVYSTCTACHDGTLGFYNVFATEDKASTAGTFGGSSTGNASVHLSDGVFVTHSLAPGGNATSTDGKTWGEKFDCASCHAPHGSYSDRLLHYSPNGMGNVPEPVGKKVANLTVVDALPAASSTAPKYVALRTSDRSATSLANGIPGTGSVIVLAKLNSTATAYERDKTPWLFGTEISNGVVSFWTQFVSGGSAVKQEDIFVNYGNAYATVVTATYNTASLTADFARAYVTKLQNSVYPMIEIDADPRTAGNQDFGGIKITKVDTRAYDELGVGEPISKYCAACHTDYYSKSGAELTGNFGMNAFRHRTNDDLLTCLKCHFAHGTDVTVMADAKDRTYSSLGKTAEARDYLLDKNASSALKRYTNMAVCWKCHTDALSSKLVNNTDFWNNYGSGNVPNTINFTDTNIPNW